MTFDQILGHDRQKDILSRSLANGRLAHAYLFSGPDGIGKRLMALALATGHRLPRAARLRQLPGLPQDRPSEPS